MKITDIKPQVKNPNRYSIFLDSKYSFSLSTDELLDQHLTVGMELDIATLKELNNTAKVDKAYMQVLNLLARRPRSVWEVEQYLEKKSIEHNTVTKIVNKLKKNELLNDTKFAESWVSNRRLLKNVSKKRLEQELYQKRISNQIISKVLSEDDVTDFDVLQELITRKLKQTRYKDKQKLMAYLIRQGFNYNDVKRVILDTKQDD